MADHNAFVKEIEEAIYDDIDSFYKYGQISLKKELLNENQVIDHKMYIRSACSVVEVLGQVF